MKHIFFWSLCSLLFLATPLAAQKQLPAKTDRLVNDFADILGRNEEVRLTVKLNRYANETSTQIAIVTETSLQGEDAFDYSNRLARAWGIGGGENDNGVLIYVATEDREVRIQTGYGAEGFLPDALSKRIIEQIIIPSFREGKYYEGLDRATSTIMDLGRGEYEGEGVPGQQQQQDKRSRRGFPFMGIVIFLVIVIIILSRFGGDDDDGGYYGGGRYDDRRRGWRRGGGWIFLPGPGSFGGWGGGGSGGGGGFGGFDGGGFGGFGGGDFGGGGAGGSW